MQVFTETKKMIQVIILFQENDPQFIELSFDRDNAIITEITTLIKLLHNKDSLNFINEDILDIFVDHHFQLIDIAVFLHRNLTAKF